MSTKNWVYLLADGDAYGNRNVSGGVYEKPQFCPGGKGFLPLPLSFECRSEERAVESYEIGRPVAGIIKDLMTPARSLSPYEIADSLRGMEEWRAFCTHMDAEADVFYAIYLGKYTGIFISRDNVTKSLSLAALANFRKCARFSSFGGAYFALITHMNVLENFIGEGVEATSIASPTSTPASSPSPSANIAPATPKTTRSQQSNTPHSTSRIDSRTSSRSRSTRIPLAPSSPPPTPSTSPTARGSTSSLRQARLTSGPQTPSRLRPQPANPSNTPLTSRSRMRVQSNSPTTRSTSTAQLIVGMPERTTPSGVLPERTRDHMEQSETESDGEEQIPMNRLQLRPRVPMQSPANPVSREPRLQVAAFDLYVRIHDIDVELANHIRAAYELVAAIGGDFIDFRDELILVRGAEIHRDILRFLYAILNSSITLPG